MTTFVTIGNAHQSFRRLLGGVLDCFDFLPQPVVVQHGHTPFDEPAIITGSFFDPDQYRHYMKTSELLIMHAGAGSIIHALKAGKRPVVMPRRKYYREHINDHQLELALTLSKMNRIEMAMETLDLPNAIHTVLHSQSEIKNIAVPNHALKVIDNTIRSIERSINKKS